MLAGPVCNLKTLSLFLTYAWMKGLSIQSVTHSAASFVQTRPSRSSESELFPSDIVFAERDIRFSTRHLQVRA